MKITVDGFVTGYDDTGGDDVPLVLLHGFPLDRAIWSAQIRSLKDVARVIAPDLRGFGQSSSPDNAATIDGYADDVLGLLDALDVPRAVIVGLSMGGYVALAFHRKYVGRVRGLVLVDTRAGPDSDAAREARDEMIALARERGAAAVAARMLPKMLTSESAQEAPAVAHALASLMEAQPVPGVVAALAAMRDRPDATPTLSEIAVPTLLRRRRRLAGPAEGDRGAARGDPRREAREDPGGGPPPELREARALQRGPAGLPRSAVARSAE
jgi:3-oxoadipate enol-lactonase